MNNTTHDVTLSCDYADMQLDVIHGFLSQSYWAKGISKNRIVTSMQNSLCFGAFIAGQQVAFARVISDKASFAYLADVFVLEDFRGQGISKRLMSYLMQHEDLQCIRRFMLCTADAHGLYQQFGFSLAKDPDWLMAIHRPNIYLTPDLDAPLPV